MTWPICPSGPITRPEAHEPHRERVHDFAGNRVDHRRISEIEIRHVNMFPSGVTVAPKGSSPTSTVATTVLVAVSIIDTVLEPALVTRRVCHPE